VLRRKRRVRVHLADPHPDVPLPTVEGLLVSKGREYVVAAAELTLAAGSKPVRPDSRLLVIPRDRVAFYEVM
jgi:hypothetical protein